jgi:hypothetical protein
MIQDPNKWLSIYMKCMYILSRNYNDKDQYAVMGIKCFIENLTLSLPDPRFCNIFKDFINMNIYVCNALFTNPKTSAFFNNYEDIKSVITTNPTEFFEFCAKSNFTMFMWVYLLDCYINILYNKSGHNIPIKSFNEVKQLYEPANIGKEDWGNATWFIIHVTPLHAQGNDLVVYNNLKAMLSCLVFILPCQKCQLHLKENLTKIDIDNCSESKMKLFECTWKLHNIVNADLGKPQPTLEEALRLYK